jgi:hypothetical protein
LGGLSRLCARTEEATSDNVASAMMTNKRGLYELSNRIEPSRDEIVTRRGRSSGRPDQFVPCLLLADLERRVCLTSYRYTRHHILPLTLAFLGGANRPWSVGWQARRQGGRFFRDAGNDTTTTKGQPRIRPEAWAA